MRQQASLNPQSSSDDSAARNQAAIELAMAMGRARNRQAIEETAKAEGVLASVSRLEGIRAQLAPLYAAIPRDVELFDLGMVTGQKPRLFVDIIAFIEMSKDMNTFRFMQETRAGRVVLAETSDEQALRAAVTDYIARRLIERENALVAHEANTKPAPSHLAAVPAGATSAVAPERLPPAATLHQENSTRPAPVPPVVPQAATPLASIPLASQQTANEAFERWTNATPVAAPLTERAEEGLAAIRKELVQIAPDAAKAISPTLPSSGNPDHARGLMATAAEQAGNAVVSGAQALQNAAQSAVAQPLAVAKDMRQGTQSMVADAASNVTEIASNTVASAVVKTAAVATAATATVAAARVIPARQTSNTGWWVWPLLALLLGIGLGAFLLYLYAANVLRP